MIKKRQVSPHVSLTPQTSCRKWGWWKSSKQCQTQQQPLQPVLLSVCTGCHTHPCLGNEAAAAPSHTHYITFQPKGKKNKEQFLWPDFKLQLFCCNLIHKSACILLLHTQVSLSLSPPLSQGLCYLQEDNTWNNSEAGVNFLKFICKWRHSVTFIFNRFTSTLNILERFSTQFCSTLFYINVILTVCLAQYQNTFFLKQNQRDVSSLIGFPKWMLQLYSQLCSRSPWDPSRSQNGSQTL